MSKGLEVLITLQDREPFIVMPHLVDHNMWDITRARHKWPTAQDAPLTWLGFLAWSAARRTGAIEQSLTWELFLADCISVERPDGEESEEENAMADPTRQALGAV